MRVVTGPVSFQSSLAASDKGTKAVFILCYDMGAVRQSLLVSLSAVVSDASSD